MSIRAWFDRVHGEMWTLLVGRALTGLAGFVGVRILTAVMAPDLYGRYALVLGYLGLVSGMLVNPLAQAMNRFVHEAAQTGAIRMFLVRGLRATSAMALLGGLGIPLFFGFYLCDEVHKTAIGGLIALTLLGANLRDRQLGMFNTFRWRKRFVILAAADAWMKTLSVAAMIWLFGASLLPTMLGMTFGTWTLALAGLPWLLQLSRYQPPDQTSAQAIQRGAFTRYALPLFGVNLLSWILASSDRYVIAGILGEADLGRYVASAQVAQAAPSLLASTFFPTFTPILFQRMATHPNEPLRLDRYALGIATLSLFFGGLLLVDVDSAFRILISRGEYQTGDSVVPFVLLGQFCYALHQVVEHEAYFQRRTGRLIVANGTAAAVGLSANLWLVPTLGVMGAAIAACATYASLLGATIWLYRPRVAKETWARIALIVLGAAAAIIAVRSMVPQEWAGWVRAPARWGLFALMFAGGAWAGFGQHLRTSAEHRQPASG